MVVQNCPQSIPAHPLRCGGQANIGRVSQSTFLKKVLEIRKLVQAIENARTDSPVGEWLLPHMTRRVVNAGTTLWHKGDPATEMLFVERGQLKLLENDETIGPGSLVGEIGLFAPDNRRTRTIVCAPDARRRCGVPPACRRLPPRRATAGHAGLLVA